MVSVLRHFFADSEEVVYSPSCTNSVKRSALVFAIFALLGATIGIPFSGDNAYYLMLVICSLILIFKGGFKISAPFMAFYAIILLNVLILDIPPFFKPVQRALLFILLTLVCTSSLETDVAVRFRAYLFRYITYGIIIIGVLSFFCFFLGINMMSRRSEMMEGFDAYSSNGGYFSGLASHSMMLGPIATISALTFYFMYQKKSRMIYLILFFVSAMSAVMASSRAALLALVVAIVYNLIVGKVNAVIRKRMIGILVFSAILSIPISGVVFKGIINKQETRAKQTSGINSRQDKFDYRINEFKSSPLLGIGFSAIDTTSGDQYTEKEGRIEPGTSHLAVLSMTGFIGFAAYLAILYKVYANTKKVRTLHSRYVFTCFLAFFVHAWFEGYILAGGGFMALLYWLVAGQCIDCPAVTRMIQPNRPKAARQ